MSIRSPFVRKISARNIYLQFYEESNRRKTTTCCRNMQLPTQILFKIRYKIRRYSEQRATLVTSEFCEFERKIDACVQRTAILHLSTDVGAKKLTFCSWKFCGRLVTQKITYSRKYDRVARRKSVLRVAHFVKIDRFTTAARNTKKKGHTEMQGIHWLIVRIHPFNKSSGQVLAVFYKRKRIEKGWEKLTVPFVHAHHSSAMQVLSTRDCNMKKA